MSGDSMSTKEEHSDVAEVEPLVEKYVHDSSSSEASRLTEWVGHQSCCHLLQSSGKNKIYIA